MTIIKKGDFVAVELITSAAIHEAVVKVFVAAGFYREKTRGVYPCEYPESLGLSIDSVGSVCWGIGGGSAKNPLTLQQLFTAENGLKWPSFATEIRTDDNAVWFFGGGKAEHICGSIQPVPHRVLATRQPKEKEVSKALDKAVIELSGQYGKAKTLYGAYLCRDFGHYKWLGSDAAGIICTRAEFEQRAKELGFINGYRWGVEYATNGKRPELEDDVEVKWFSCVNGFVATGFGKVNSIEWSANPESLFHEVNKFTIVDQRYKPQDARYPQTPPVDTVEEVAHGDLSYLSIAISDAMNAAVEAGKVDIAKRFQEINKDVLAEAIKRKAELEKKALIQQGYEIVGLDTTFNVLEKLIDAGWRPTK